ncbi:MAG: NAD(P) transhydrogenase subunit alpha [Pseudomonadota bacterium]
MLKRAGYTLIAALLATSPALAATGQAAVDPFIFRIAIFVLAAFVGYYVVWAVTPALHTPLMSVTNAISAVVVVGAIVATAAMHLVDGQAAPPTDQVWIARGLGAAAVGLACINIFGGFMVTQRMLAMYKKKDKPAADT